MQMRKKISVFFIMTCASFTIIMLIYTALAEWMKADLTQSRIFALFGVCAMVAAVISATDFSPAQSVLVRLAIDFADVFLTVFLLGGGVMKLFTFNMKTMLTVFGMLSAAFVGVAALVLANEIIHSGEINQKIAEMKRKN